MNKFIYTPSGLSDVFENEYKQKKEIEAKAAEVFEEYGYKPVQTPMFEFSDIYDAASTLPSEKIFKFFDRDGRTLALRPDITTSIARIAATKMSDANEPLKLCYAGSSFRNDESFSRDRQREFTQTGVELLGDYSVEADAEVIRIAIKTLLACGLKKFKIGIGHSQKSNEALEELQKVFEILENEGYAKYLFIDSEMVPNLDYYTGIIVKGYTYKVGFPLVSGGRYDTLTEKFGKPMPATGISIDIERVMSALANVSTDDEDEYVTVALAKGRLSEYAIGLFETAGYDVSAMKEKSRKLIFEDTANKLRFILVKAGDVPTYVEYGAADIGIVGKDTILEEGKKLFEMAAFDFGHCKISVCGKNESQLKDKNILQVATKYPNIAKDYFHKKGQTVDIIKLNGSVELGPLIELSDVIVDIVESGKTLEENGLKVLEDICELSARLIVNRVSIKMKREKILEISDKLKDAGEKRGNK